MAGRLRVSACLCPAWPAGVFAKKLGAKHGGDQKSNGLIWGVPEMGVPQKLMVYTRKTQENPTKMDVLGVPPFQETLILM